MHLWVPQEIKASLVGISAVALQGLDLLAVALSMFTQQQKLIAREVGGIFLFVMQRHR